MNPNHEEPCYPVINTRSITDTTGEKKTCTYYRLTILHLIKSFTIVVSRINSPLSTTVRPHKCFPRDKPVIKCALNVRDSADSRRFVWMFYVRVFLALCAARLPLLTAADCKRLWGCHSSKVLLAWQHAGVSSAVGAMPCPVDFWE